MRIELKRLLPIMNLIGFNQENSIICMNTNIADNIQEMWRRGVVVMNTAQLHSAKPQLRFCAGSNPACGVSEIRDGEDL